VFYFLSKNKFTFSVKKFITTLKKYLEHRGIT